ncbi:MAG TPA: FixH family protein [Methylomirabilota bacterium]|jgi:hypothetical protein|nr:FixH family protein [Methylomirabilota bacterium]
MPRRFGVVVLGLAVLVAGLGLAWGAELKPIHTQKTKDLVVRLLSESGQWKPGKNGFVLEFVSAKDNTLLDAGTVTLNTSMPMPGMAPMIAGAKLTPDQAPGRYVGTIEFPDRGTREVRVSWEGPAGRGSTKFSVPVR